MNDFYLLDQAEELTYLGGLNAPLQHLTDVDSGIFRKMIIEED